MDGTGRVFALLFVFLLRIPALAAEPRCGLSVSTSGTPKASDALGILRSAVGSRSCDLCVCDVDRNSKLAASDALLTLRFGVGQPVALRCVACPVQQTIGAAGGSMTSSDGTLKITFPPGSLGTNTQITLAGLAPSLRGPATDAFPISDVYTLEPQGIDLEIPAEIELSVPASSPPEGGRRFDLVSILKTTSSAELTHSPRGQVEYVRIATISGGSFFYVPGTDVSLKLKGVIDSTGALEIYAHALADVFLPEETSTGAISTFDLHITPRFTEPEDGAFQYKVRYRDEEASGYTPLTGAPLVSSFADLLMGQDNRYHSPYECESTGTQSYSATIETEVTTSDGVQTDSIEIESAIECSPSLNLGTHYFPWSCVGFDDEFAFLSAGPRIACPVRDNQGSGFAIYAPEVDPEDEPFAMQLSLKYELNAGDQYKLAVMYDPGGSDNDAIFEAGQGYRFWRHLAGDNWASIGSDPVIGRYWSDIAPTVIQGTNPSVLMTDATDREFYRAEYDGSSSTVTPTKILDDMALNAMGANGNLISGKLLRPTGPLIGVTSALGQTPGKIFTHDLSSLTSAGTVVGPAGNTPECIHCDESLCFITNSGDSTMTLVEWGEKSAASILGSVPIGALPNSGHIRWLGGTRHVILTTGRSDNTVSVTIVDTAADDPVESQTEMPAPAGCVTPAFVDFLDENDSVVVSCQTPGSIGVIAGVVPR